MRWFVSRNGQTSGPVDEAEVAAWVRGGMADASVRDEMGGNWMPVAQSPFASLVPRLQPPSARQASNAVPAFVALGSILTLGGCVGMVDGCIASGNRATELYAGFGAMSVGFVLFVVGRVISSTN